jgi:hypothetical protein
MRRAVVHIGLGRCGSTYLQKLFSELSQRYSDFVYVAPVRQEIEDLEYRYLKDSSSFRVPFLDNIFQSSSQSTVLIASEFLSCKPLALFALVKRLSSDMDDVTISLLYRPESELVTSFFYKFFLHIDLTYYHLKKFMQDRGIRFSIFKILSADQIFKLFCIVDGFRFFSLVVPRHIPVPCLEKDFFLCTSGLVRDNISLISLPLQPSCFQGELPLFQRYVNAVGLDIDDSFRPDLDLSRNESMNLQDSHQSFLDLFLSMGHNSRQYIRKKKKGQPVIKPNHQYRAPLITHYLEWIIARIYTLYFKGLRFKRCGPCHKLLYVILFAIRLVLLRLTLYLIRYISLFTS